MSSGERAFAIRGATRFATTRCTSMIFAMRIRAALLCHFDFRLLTPLVLLSVLASAAFAMRIPPAPPAPRIHFQVETLANGLRIIYSPLHQSPVVHVEMVYHVGSRDDPPGRHGFAHLFEHMMFRGSAHVGPEDHVSLVRSVGGDCNGQTTQDATFYFETLPANQLPLALFLEADRLASFHVSENSYRIERNVVLHELARRLDNPIAVLADTLSSAVFGAHPYGASPAGSPDDLQHATIPELDDFFHRYYVPNNATLIITGDFDPIATRAIVHRNFEWIPRGPKVRHPPLPASGPIPLDQPRQSETHANVHHPAIVVGCRTQPYTGSDDVALDVLTAILSERLKHQLNFQNHPLCTSVLAREFSYQRDGCLCIEAMLQPEADLATLKRTLIGRLAILRDDGVSLNEDQFALITQSLRAQWLERRQTAQGLGKQLAEGDSLARDPRAVDEYLDRLGTLTVPMIYYVIQKYLRPDALTMVLVHPSTQPAPQAAPAAETIPEPTTSPALAKSIAFPPDYPTTAPVSRESPALRMDPITRFQANGFQVLLVKSFNPSRMDLQFIFPTGYTDDPPGKEGLGRLTADVFATMAEKPDRDLEIGLPVHPGIPYIIQHHVDETTVSVSAPLVLSDHIAREINRALTEPLDIGIFEQRLLAMKWKLYNQARDENEVAEFVAAQELNRALFGRTAEARTLSASSLRAIHGPDLLRWRDRLFDLHHAALVISADITESQARDFVNTIQHDTPPSPPLTITPQPAAGDVTQSADKQAAATRPHPSKIILINAPNIHEPLILIGSRAFAEGSGDLPAAQVGQWILSQRIWHALRSQMGYAYVLGGGFSPHRDSGLFTISTETSVSQTGATLELLLDNLQKISRDLASADELTTSRQAIAGHHLIALQTPDEQALYETRSLIHHETDLSDLASAAQAVTADQVRAVFQQYANPQNAIAVVIGPASAVRDQLKPFGNVELLPMPNHRSTASTRPAYDLIPNPQ